MAHLLKIRQLPPRNPDLSYGYDHPKVIVDLSEDNPLCHFCRNKGIWGHLSTLNVLKPAWMHGFITDPQDVDNADRRSCPFCKMVFDLLPETAFAEEQRHMYLSESVSQGYCSLRPVAIRVRHDTFTSFVVVYKFREYVSHFHKITYLYRGSIGLDSDKRRCFNSVAITAVKLQDTLDPALVRKWISRCQRSHTLCTQTKQRFASRSLPTMMIDVRRSCLVEAKTDYRYAALSYVWGQVQSLQATKANVDTLKTSGALRREDLWNHLPRVIQDCIKLTETIDIPYLWVDRLCIVQDDVANKHDQIAGMDTIYLQAQITLVPFAGKNAQANIPGVLPGTRASVSLPVSSTSCTRGACGNIILTSIPEWPNITFGAVHETRAWTLQEKVLSTRCVFMSRWGMWFQCLTSRYSDMEPGELPTELKSNSRNALLNLEPSKQLSVDDWGGWDRSRINEFLSFAVHVEWYSERKLTFQIDRIDAFRGILNVFRDTCQQEFLWAHPEGQLLPISLLWIHVDVGRSRDAYGTADDLSFYQDYFPDRDTDYPTWSWIGWSSRVSYSLVFELDKAGVDAGLDDSVSLATQPALDEEAVRRQGLDYSILEQSLPPALFHRHLNRGFLEIQGPTISIADMCCGPPKSVHISALDDTSGAFALANALYPFFQEDSLLLPRDEPMAAPPCGMLFGIPFWRHTHYENQRFILLKTIPAEFAKGSVRKLSEWNAHIDSLFNGSEGESFCIALLVLVSDDEYAERQGVAVLDKAFWDSRDPVVRKYLLL